jgi:hypothetical protein
VVVVGGWRWRWRSGVVKRRLRVCELQGNGQKPKSQEQGPHGESELRISYP